MFQRGSSNFNIFFTKMLESINFWEKKSVLKYCSFIVQKCFQRENICRHFYLTAKMQLLGNLRCSHRAHGVYSKRVLVNFQVFFYVSLLTQKHKKYQSFMMMIGFDG